MKNCVAWMLVTASLLGGWLMALPARGDAIARGAWVGTWMAAQQLGDTVNSPPASVFTNATLRQSVHVSLGGRRLRLRFSNLFGRSPLSFDVTHVAVAVGGGAIRPGTDRVVTFNGRKSMSVPAGREIVSDPVAFQLAPLSDLAITVHVTRAPDEITTHPGSRTTSYLQKGNAVSARELPDATAIDHWYFASNVEVLASDGAAVVTLGDSITDGRGTTTNANTRWPDFLAARLQRNPGTAHVAVLNAGIGGNRVVSGGLGPTALSRLERDVLAQRGVRWLIVLEGINDIGAREPEPSGDAQAPIAQRLIAAYEKIIRQARARGIRVFGATLPAVGGSQYDNPANEAARQTVNRWIRESGRFDGVVDFDAALRHPSDPTRLAPVTESADGLHPGNSGYRLMADAIPLTWFEHPSRARSTRSSGW